MDTPDPDLPLSLRRTRRSSGVLSAARSSPAPAAKQTAVVPDTAAGGTTAATPTSQCRSRPLGAAVTTRKRRVRFSDPGPSVNGARDAATGLTPALRRTSLGCWPPASPPLSPSSPSHGRRASRAFPAIPPSGTVTFLPLRQVLDGRVQRRLRRNGLSEEMNTLVREKRQRAAAAQAEMAQLRAAVAAKDAEIEALQRQAGGVDDTDDADDTIAMDTDRILDLEREVAALRQQVAGQDAAAPPHDDSEAVANWTLAARDPFSTEYEDDDNEVIDMDNSDDAFFGESTIAELQCSTPSRRTANKRKRADTATTTEHDDNDPFPSFSSFPTPPATSPITTAGIRTPTPTTPGTPTFRCPVAQHSAASFLSRETAATAAVRRLLTPSPAHHGSLSLTADVEVQTTATTASMQPDLETARLRDELASLQRDAAALTAALEAYQAWAGRLDELLPGQREEDDRLAAQEKEHRDAGTREALEKRVTTVLRALSDKTAVLAELSEQVCGLGFSSSPTEEEDGGETSETDTDPFAALAGLAAAFRAARLELEYLAPGENALPLTAPGGAVLALLVATLRDLGRRGRAADAQIDEYHALEGSLRQQLGARVAAMDGLVAEAAAATARGDDLAVAVDRMKGAMASYARDVAELEALVERVEAAKVAAEGGKAEAEAAAAEAKAEATSEAGRALALRDARVLELHGEIEQVNAALRAAHETAQQLRVDKAGLRAALDSEQQRTAACRAAVAALQSELSAVVGRLGAVAAGVEPEAQNVTAAEAPSGRKRFSLSGRRRRSKADVEDDNTASTSVTTTARPSKKRRRRYDSGLGFLDEEEVDVEVDE